MKTLARRHARQALTTLVDIMESGESEAARIAAAEKLLDRAHGRVRAESDSAIGKSFEQLVREAAGQPDVVPETAKDGRDGDDEDGA